MNERRSRSACGEHLAGKLILADIPGLTAPQHDHRRPGRHPRLRRPAAHFVEDLIMRRLARSRWSWPATAVVTCRRRQPTSGAPPDNARRECAC